MYNKTSVYEGSYLYTVENGVPKTHDNVSCSPRKWGAHNTVSILTGRQSSDFHVSVATSMIPSPNGTKFTVEVPST